MAETQQSAKKTVAFEAGYEANADVAIGGVFRHEKHLEAKEKDYFDEYLAKLHRQKHSLVIEEDLRELKRVDQSLLNMIRTLDHRRLGDLEALHDQPRLPATDYRLQRFLEQKEYEKKMLEMKLELREDQIRQLLDLIKTGGKPDAGLEASLGAQGDKDAGRGRLELEQLKRLTAKQGAEIEVRDQKIAQLAKDAALKQAAADKLALELETFKKKGFDSSAETQTLRRDVDKLKEDARRLVGDKEKLLAEAESLKRSLAAREADWTKERQRLNDDHEAKLLALQGNQALAGRSKDQEAEALRADVVRLNATIGQLQAAERAQADAHKKFAASLEQQIVGLKNELAGAQDRSADRSTLEASQRREADLRREVDALKAELASKQYSSSANRQAEQLQRDLAASQAQTAESSSTVAKLRQELAASQSQTASLRQELDELRRASSSSAGDDKLKKEVVELKVELQKATSALALANAKVAEQEKALAAAASGGDSASKALQVEVDRLKAQLATEDSKRQAVVVRFNEKIAERDKEIELLKASSKGGSLDAGNKVFAEKAELETQVSRLKTELAGVALSREELKALEAGSSDAQVAKLKDLIKKKNDLLAAKMDELKAKTDRCAELEAIVARSGSGSGSGTGNAALEKEVQELRDENANVREKFSEQMNTLMEMSDTIDKYETLLRKNKIAFK